MCISWARRWVSAPPGAGAIVSAGAGANGMSYGSNGCECGPSRRCKRTGPVVDRSLTCVVRSNLAHESTRLVELHLYDGRAWMALDILLSSVPVQMRGPRCLHNASRTMVSILLHNGCDFKGVWTSASHDMRWFRGRSVTVTAVTTLPRVCREGRLRAPRGTCCGPPQAALRPMGRRLRPPPTRLPHTRPRGPARTMTARWPQCAAPAA